MASTEAEKNAIFQNESVENADAIVRDILASRVERTTEDGKEVSDVVLQYGRKDMTITFRHGIRLSGGLLVNVYLENVRDEAHAKKHEIRIQKRGLDFPSKEHKHQNSQGILVEH